MDEGRKTPFYEKHLALGGKIVNYSGWLLPVQFPQGLVEEVINTRKGVSLFDVSHMGEISVKGRGAEAYLQKMVTNDLARLKNNAVMYSPVCYPDGGVVDDILVYRVEDDNYLLVVNAANTDKDFDWFMENLSGDVVLTNLSPDYAQLALQGPDSEKILQSLVSEPLEKIRNYHFVSDLNLAGAKCLVSRTGYTGEDGFEIYCSNEDASKIWDAVWEAGQKYSLSAAGLGSRDVLRLEASMPLYGHELSSDLNPLMAGLDRFVALGKAVSFNGQEALKIYKQEGLTQKLFGLEMADRGVPREGYPVSDGESELGWISSGTYSPTLDKFIAMAFLDPKAVKPGDQVVVTIRNRSYGARIIKMPFYRRDY